nr:NEL-type E3 ubiquitin ligase domain-containing protein [Pseudomonas sp. BSw22131]
MQQRFSEDPVLRVIHHQLPKAFSAASTQQQQDYRRALLASKSARHALKTLLKPLKGLSDFAEPLLRQALDTRFGPGLEPKVDTLFHPTLRPSGATGSASQLTLLEAALHNFERKEAIKGGFLRSASVDKGLDGPHPKNIPPDQFADVCRHLNIGSKYQDHLKDVLEPMSLPGDAPNAARLNARAIFITNDLADMELYARAAALRKDISEQALAAVLDVVTRRASPMFNGLPVAFESLSLLGVEIPRVVIIKPLATWTFTQVPLVLYVPQDPVTPFKEFATLSELEDDLRSRLMSQAYQAFFARLIGERGRAQFFGQLNRHLFPLAPVDGSWFTKGLWHNTPDHRADLRLQSAPIDTELFQRMHQQQIAVIKDNARFLAVPTEDEDAKSRSERLQAWFDVGMNIANVASFFVPVLGQLMMVYASVELVSEVYHGLEDLSHGDLEEGFDHLVSAGANIAFMAALATTAHGVSPKEPPPLASNNFVGKVVPIKLANGQARLWKPDLEPFQVNIDVPQDTSAELSGVFEREGKKYLTLDGQQYEVIHRKDLNKWQLGHPHPDAKFSPVLEHNGVGAFRHEGERPQQWSKVKLFKRLGHTVSGLSESSAEQILRVTDVDESLLRQVHVENAVPPGQLRDTVKRFQLDTALDNAAIATSGSQRAEQFRQQYEASEVSSDPLVQLIRRDFPGVSTAVAEDLASTLTSAQTLQILDNARLPLRVSEAAVWQQRQTRLNRAFEGFYLKSVSNADTEILSLRLLEKLPGWSDQVRLEVRLGSTEGSLLDSIGVPEATVHKVLVKSNGQYQAFDAQGNELNSVPKAGNNLCASILHALPDAHRSALGFSHVSQGPQLNTALATLATGDRARASRLLGIRDGRLKFNKPERMKQGRMGYALSGMGQLLGFISEDHLLTRIGLLELIDVTAQDVLTSLRLEGMSNADINARLDVLQDERQALRTSLDQWAMASSEILAPSESRMNSRARIGEAILQHWQATSLPGVPANVALRLESARLSDFPEQLPGFFYSRVERLQLSNIVAQGEPGSLMGGRPWSSIPLENFLSRFTEITVLEISRSPSSGFSFTQFHELPRIVTTQLPGLRALSLINQGVDITAETLNLFGQMPHLESLDLSGNFSLDAPLPGSVNLNLRRLGLDRIGLEQWPEWLTELLPGHIEEVSLADNQILYLPDGLLQTGQSARTTLIHLQGNRLSRTDMIEACLRAGEQPLAGQLRAVRIDPGAPVELQPRINVLLGEQAVLEAALRDWAEASTSHAPFSDQSLITRREMGAALRDHWRGTVAGRASLPIMIESMALAEFPQGLPQTFYQNINGLMLRNVATDPEELSQFLTSFPDLETLEIMGHVMPMVSPPRTLSALPNLRSLALMDQGMVIDQAVMEYLSSLDNLRNLDLSGNHLAPIVASPGLIRHWESLTLDKVGISTWPNWLNEFLPGGIDALSLARNELRELPDEIVRNRRNISAHTEISLEGNPLSRETMIGAHVSEYGNSRSFSFYMDLPDDIRALAPERAWSSTESLNQSDSDFDPDSDADTSVHRHGSTGADSAQAANVEQWLQDTAQENIGHQAVWDQIAAAGDAPMLMALIGRLRETADYLRAREALVQRVWHVLGAAANDSQLRQLLNAMAGEAIASRTCGDGVRLEFNQMEVQVFALDSLRDIPNAERGPTLYRLMRRFYRLDEVDRLARTNAMGRDQAEVRLAYRLQLAERLDLPLPPARMLYRTAAAVTAVELQTVEAQVLTRQDGPEFFANAVNRDFWASWLRETYAADFAELKATFEGERIRVEDEFPELDDAYLARIKSLDEEQKMREHELMKQLTYQEGMKYSD